MDKSAKMEEMLSTLISMVGSLNQELSVVKDELAKLKNEMTNGGQKRSNIHSYLVFQ